MNGGRKGFLNPLIETWMDSGRFINGGQNIQQSSIIVVTSAALHMIKAGVEAPKYMTKTDVLITTCCSPRQHGSFCLRAF
jgi:hypothetical protein